MQKTARLMIVGATIVTLLVLALVAPALAATVINRQSSPGMHERTIWDQTQVQIRKLPFGVNHTGPIHMELTFKPTTSADLDIYLLDSNGDALNMEQGYMGIFAGKEYIDFYVDDVVDQSVELIDPDDDWSEEYMVGDTYYLVVVAFNGAAEYNIWGYYPQIWLDDGYDVSANYNYYLQSYRFPATAGSWAKITGPRYGGQYDFRPTSAGNGTCRLEWPADIVNKVVTYDRVDKPMPFNVEHYLYAGVYWDEVIANTSYDDDPDDNYLPTLWVADGVYSLGDWYGFGDEFYVAESAWEDVLWAQRLAHYVPSLSLAYAEALLGPDGAPKTGRSTMGFKAVLTWPENLWLKKYVKYRTYYKVYGTYSLNGERVGPGVPIKIQRKTAKLGWATVKTVYTNDAGAWSVKLSPTVKWWVRARAVGDETTGLMTEDSITKTLKAL